MGRVSHPNFSSHKRPKVRALIEAVGATLRYLPPSPDFNPTKRLFARFKAMLRKAAERTVECLGASSASAWYRAASSLSNGGSAQILVPRDEDDTAEPCPSTLGSTIGAPTWPALPRETRLALTELMARLLIDHADRNAARCAMEVRHDC